MHVLNVMFGKKKGGIEQAFVDYAVALSDNDTKVTTLTFPGAPVLSLLPSSYNITQEYISNLGKWDLIAIWKLKRLINKIKPDAIITHGNRANILLRKATKDVPVIGVCHNYQLKHIVKCDAVLSITNDLRKKLIMHGVQKENVHVIPNMVSITENTISKIKYSDPPIIGSMGRFVAKKGFKYMIEAAELLKLKAVPFKMVIAGDGPERENLKKLISEKNLLKHVELLPWVEDKSEFFNKIDIFCLPSLHEPFGIVLLEAMLHQKPVVTTDSEGPMEIVRPYHDALMANKQDARSLAISLEKLLNDKDLAYRLSKHAVETVKEKFDRQEIGEKIKAALEKIIVDYKCQFACNDNELEMV
jgi:glycosyltransferase involved in cell wall biosynthesis